MYLFLCSWITRIAHCIYTIFLPDPGNNFGRSWQLGNNRQNPSRPKTKFASGRKMCRINCVQQRSSSQPTIPHGVWRSRCHRLVPVTQYNTARTTRDEIRWGEMCGKHCVFSQIESIIICTALYHLRACSDQTRATCPVCMETNVMICVDEWTYKFIYQAKHEKTAMTDWSICKKSPVFTTFENVIGLRHKQLWCLIGKTWCFLLICENTNHFTRQNTSTCVLSS